MGMYISARAILAGVAAITLAGCGSAATTSGAAGGSPAASASGSAGASSASATTDGTASPSAAAGTGTSAPFPVAVGNTWVYEGITSLNNAHSTDTKKVLSVTPTAGGRRVTMSDTIIPGSVTAAQTYIFYDNGQIGFPVAQSHGISVISGNGIVWPDAADLASGQVSHSTAQVKLASGQYETADVTVQGGGTQSVSVPAGTYQATLVNMTIVTHVGSFTTTITIKEWTAPGTGPVKSEEVIQAAGQSQLITTEALLSFKKG